jgi:TrpR family transcriptional regulator, trp operon repressor
MDMKVKCISHLVNHLLAQQNQEQMEEVLRCLLTESELIDVAKRLQIFEMLEQGVPQRQIAEKLGAGIATVTRGSNTLKNRQKILPTSK